MTVQYIFEIFWPIHFLSRLKFLVRQTKPPETRKRKQPQKKDRIRYYDMQASHAAETTINHYKLNFQRMIIC